MPYVAASPSFSVGNKREDASDWRAVVFPWVLHRQQVVGTLDGRTALWLGLRRLLRDHRRVLVPAFLCPTIIPPVRAASMEVGFYDVDEHLEPRVDHIEALLRLGQPAVVLVLHYCGFAPSGLADVATVTKRYGGTLIEDCAHASLSSYSSPSMGSTGDMSIFSLRKEFAVPDGGALVVNNTEYPGTDPLKTPGALSTALKLTYLLLGVVEARLRWSPRTRLLSFRRIRNGLQDREDEVDDFDQRVYGFGMSSLSEAILARQEPQRMAARRRANYAYLLEQLWGISPWRPLYPELPQDVVPFGFPLICDPRDQIREQLLRRGVNARAYWDALPRGVTSGEFPNAVELSRKILVLPVHQDVSEANLAHMVSLLRQIHDRISRNSQKRAGVEA